MMPAKLKLPTSRTLLSLKMMLAKLPLPILKTSQSLKTMVARLTLLLSMPEQMLRLLPETVRTRPSMTELTRRYPTVNLLSLTCKTGGTYMFQFHIATYDNKKALLSIRKNGEEIASIFDQNHKDNHKNSMAGQNIIMDVKRGDEIVVYAYTGTWLADFPMNHYTHWVGLLLKPSEEEIESLRKAAEEV